jgi:hypothetical protein
MRYIVERLRGNYVVYDTNNGKKVSTHFNYRDALNKRDELNNNLKTK